MNATAELENQQETIIKEKTIEFIDSIPGFLGYKDYIIILNEDEENPFHKLQSIEEPELSFIIINPFLFKPDYDFKLPESTIEKLDIEEVKDILVYSVVTIPQEDYTKITANLLGPIIINTKNNKAKQVALNENEYTTKHYIVDGSRA